MKDTIQISKLYPILSKIANGLSLHNLETDTLLIEISDLFPGAEITNLLRDKVNLLKVISYSPEAFYKDPLFMTYSTTVMNNEEADFDFLIPPNSLELAYAIVEMAKTLHIPISESPIFSDECRAFIRRILIEDGFSVPVHPFDIVGGLELEPGQTAEDTQNKLKAIVSYIEHMSMEVI